MTVRIKRKDEEMFKVRKFNVCCPLRFRRQTENGG